MNNPVEGKINDVTGVKSNEDQVYYPELDGIRFFGFLIVLLHHSTLFSNVPYLSTIRNNGYIGVDIFFVLSAFLFTKLLVTEHNRTKKISFKKFYLRRVFRIWPIYFLFILFSIFFYAFIKHGTFTHEVEIRELGLFIFSDNIFAAVKGTINPLPFVGHLWTIGFEEQFYLFIPLVIYLLVRASYKARVIALITLFVLFNLIRFLFITKNVPHPAIWVLPITRFESIFLGIVIGFGGLDFLLRKYTPEMLGLLGVLFFILLCQFPDPKNTSYWQIASYTVVGITSALILLAVLYSRYFRKICSVKPIVFIGKRSYGLYVYHIFAIYLAKLMIERIPSLPTNSFTIYMYSLIIAVIASFLSYRFVEKPFLILKKKYEVVTSRPV